MDAAKVEGAARALKKYLKSTAAADGKSQLFEDDGEFVFLVVRSKRYFSEYKNLKPKLVALPAGVFSKRSEPPAVCLFTRDPQRDYKDALLGATPVTRCIGVSKLKGKFKPYEARRALRADFDVFLAESDVVAALPRLLGKAFYGKLGYIPLPVNVRHSKDGAINAEAVAHRVTKILNSTPVVYPASHTMLVRIGTTKHSSRELAQNAAAVADFVGLDGIVEVSLRTNQSPTLPVYYADRIYSESDVGEHTDDEFETEGVKRKREDARLDELLAEVVDEDEIREYNREQKKRRKRAAA